jgi:MFS family permease
MVEASMPIRLLSGKLSGVFTRHALVSIFLLTNAFVWYSYAIVVLQKSIDALNLAFLPNMLVWSTHFAALIISALAGVGLTRKFGGRTRFLAVWVVVGTVLSLTPFVVNPEVTWGAVTLGLVYGFCFGFGMPNCMGYFTEQTPIENRGRIGGFIILLTGVLTVGIDLLGINSLPELTLTLAVLRATALIPVAFSKPTVQVKEKSAMPSYRSVLKQKPFVLYFVPWIMFALLNYLTTPVQQNVFAFDPTVVVDLQLLGNVFLAAFALIGGVFMDSVGRKRMAIIGFVMVGLSFSILGFFHDTPVWYVHTVINGTSWGILYVLFVVTVWGDLSQEAPSDKFYALGASPFFISKFLSLTINAQIVSAIPVEEIFSFTALFLFLAVLPLIYAPETLPEKIMKDRELKNYIEKAKKEVSKAQENQRENEQGESEKSEVEFQVIPEDEKKAQELAEKYY